MLSVDIRDIVREMAPLVLKDTWRRGYSSEDYKDSWLVAFDIRLAVGDTSKNFFLKLLITSSHELFYNWSDKYRVLIQNTEWVFGSSHDSCWHHMEFLPMLYFNSCDKYFPDVMPAQIRKHCFFCFGSENTVVMTQTAKNENDDYSKVVKDIRWRKNDGQ